MIHTVVSPNSVEGHTHLSVLPFCVTVVRTVVGSGDPVCGWAHDFNSLISLNSGRLGSRPTEENG